MSDTPQGPGWWLASDGTWHPPELHPSMGTADPAVPSGVPEVRSPILVPSLPGYPLASTEDHRPQVGPMYPDLFQQAVAGSRLAEVVTVNFADGDHRETLDVAASIGAGGSSSFLLEPAGRGPIEVGEFTGATARKRRRRH